MGCHVTMFNLSGFLTVSIAEKYCQCTNILLVNPCHPIYLHSSRKSVGLATTFLQRKKKCLVSMPRKMFLTKTNRKKVMKRNRKRKKQKEAEVKRRVMRKKRRKRKLKKKKSKI